MPLKIGLVGAGHMGRIHLQKLSAMEDIEVAGVADVDTSWTCEVSPKDEIPCFTDYMDLIKVSDAVPGLAGGGCASCAGGSCGGCKH